MEAVHGELYEETSQQFVGQWNRLVSTTNWEKGRIIQTWRQALVESGAPVQEHSDETWSRHVGHVSPQHVGRLRRVWERFAAVRDQYDGLYWSHFQAALDWDDAEMWLEGAVQNRWSVAQMRTQRAETLGDLQQHAGADSDLSSELDEDAEPPQEQMLSASVGVVQDPGAADGETGHWTGEREDEADDEPSESLSPAGDFDRRAEPAPRVRPFENLPPLPDDLCEAVEQFKLAILRHKLAGWQEVSPGDVVSTLEALRALALAPSDE